MSFKAWLRTKWETAEEWLPWFVGGCAVLVLLVGIVYGFLRNEERGPAGFAAVTNSDVSAVSVHAVELAPGARKKTFIVALKTNPSEAEIEARTGILAVRSRAVILAANELLRPHGRETKIQLELFKDVAPVVVLKVTSGFEVNEGMHSGVAVDDPASSVSLTTANGMVSGFIKYRGKEYRIVADPERGVHYIIEVKR